MIAPLFVVIDSTLKAFLMDPNGPEPYTIWTPDLHNAELFRAREDADTQLESIRKLREDLDVPTEGLAVRSCTLTVNQRDWMEL